jgi:hypothetical protein
MKGVSFGELKAKAAKDFFNAWREARNYGMELFFSETGEKIDIGDVEIGDISIKGE